MSNWKNKFNGKPEPVAQGSTRMIVDIPNKFLDKLKAHKIPFNWALKFFMDSFFQSMKEREQENAIRANSTEDSQEKEKLGVDESQGITQSVGHSDSLVQSDAGT